MAHRDVHIDFNHSIDSQGKNGIGDQDLQKMEGAWLEVHQGLHAMHEMGQVQFMHLPFLETVHQDLVKKVEVLREQFDTMVVLGIGGSALGAKAIQEACSGPILPGIGNHSGHRLFILDTLDPDYLTRVLEHLDPKKTVFNVVSKSGNTVETMAQFMVFYRFLKSRLGEKEFRRHLIMTTDPEKGTLRRLCQEEGFENFQILPGVGGRFSVLSPVGLVPAAFLGISIQEMAEGAIHMDKRCRLGDLWTNPAAMLSVVCHLLHHRMKRQQLVVFNYAENLNSLGQWFCQLWAESLGKKQDLNGKEVHTGITPVLASGPRDQHSQVQLFVEGPADKMVMFWQQDKFQEDVEIPELFQDRESLSYLGGKKISDVLYAETLATEQALTESGTPSFKVHLYGSDPYTLGQLFFLFEVATVYLGGLWNVNPYNQPGVELGKKYIYGKLGRSEFEPFGGKLARRLKEKRYVV